MCPSIVGFQPIHDRSAFRNCTISLPFKGAISDLLKGLFPTKILIQVAVSDSKVHYLDFFRIYL